MSSAIEFDVLTLFPEMLQAFFREGVLHRALDQKLLNIFYHQIRQYSQDKHRRVDERPYGGGAGMVLQAEPLFLAWQAAQARNPKCKARTILFTPQGQRLKQKAIVGFAKQAMAGERFILVCGRYEGIDERFIEECVDEEWSLGDFVISGGELAAAAFIDSVGRMIPGVLGNAASLLQESFSDENNLEYPQYTRPESFHGRDVPKVLLSGNHQEIIAWRNKKAEERTKKYNYQAPVFAALLHHSIRDKQGKQVTTAITNLDIHDISRSARTYGIKNYYLVNPLEEQQYVAKRIQEHWLSSGGKEYNPDRAEAFSTLKIVSWLEEAIADIEKSTGKAPFVVMTSAREPQGVRQITNLELRGQITSSTRPILLVFGTGWGIDDELLRKADCVLEPIASVQETAYRHLSVRSAAAIVFDRLLGAKNE